MTEPFSAAGAAKFFNLMKDVPLWILVAVFLSLVAFLATPSFRGLAVAELTWLRYGVIVIAIFIMCRVVNIASTRRSDFERREAKRFEKIFAPLMGLFLNIYITSSRAEGAPRFRQRLRNARELLFDIKSPRVACRRAFRALFDKQIIGPHAEVEYGGDFPREEIQRIVRENTQFADNKLINYVAGAGRAQYEDMPAEGALTDADYGLFEYILSEHTRLNKKHG